MKTAGQAAKVANRIGGGTGEALVVIGAKLLQPGVGFSQGGGAGEAQFADQTVLKGAPGALDAAFGLGRVGRDLVDAELLQCASELSGRLFSDELFGHGPVRVVALEDGVAVAVEAERRFASTRQQRESSSTKSRSSRRQSRKVGQVLRPVGDRLSMGNGRDGRTRITERQVPCT
jgi:hypothetical protein